MAMAALVAEVLVAVAAAAAREEATAVPAGRAEVEARGCRMVGRGPCAQTAVPRRRLDALRAATHPQRTLPSSN